jgi:prevent-host-death family protein
MPRIGVRQLKTHASEVTREVQQKHLRYTITNRGEPVAMLIPYSPAEEGCADIEDDPWEEYRALRERISLEQKEPFFAVELMRDQRS